MCCATNPYSLFFSDITSSAFCSGVSSEEVARGEGHPGEGEGSGGRVTAEARGGWLGAAVPLAPSTPASTAGGAEDLGSEEEDDARRLAEEDDAHAGDRAEEDTHDGGPRVGREGRGGRARRGVVIINHMLEVSLGCCD